MAVNLALIDRGLAQHRATASRQRAARLGGRTAVPGGAFNPRVQLIPNNPGHRGPNGNFVYDGGGGAELIPSGPPLIHSGGHFGGPRGDQIDSNKAHWQPETRRFYNQHPIQNLSAGGSPVHLMDPQHAEIAREAIARISGRTIMPDMPPHSMGAAQMMGGPDVPSHGTLAPGANAQQAAYAPHLNTILDRFVQMHYAQAIQNAVYQKLLRNGFTPTKAQMVPRDGGTGPAPRIPGRVEVG